MKKIFLKVIYLLLTLVYAVTTTSLESVYARDEQLVLNKYNLPLLKGISFNPNNPLELDFYIDTCDFKTVSTEETLRIIRYFIAGLSIADNDLWVNLSPYESQRIIPKVLENTELGDGLLEQDYILKKISSALTDPDYKSGSEYWKELESAEENNSFVKAWVVPDKAEVYSYGNSAFINAASLEVVSEADYLASSVNNSSNLLEDSFEKNIMPKLKKALNDDASFAKLRQIYHSIILAKWFKEKFKNSFYEDFIDSEKVKGINVDNDGYKEKVFAQYVENFKKGSYRKSKKLLIANQKTIKKNYVSGGCALAIDVDEVNAYKSPHDYWNKNAQGKVNRAQIEFAQGIIDPVSGQKRSSAVEAYDPVKQTQYKRSELDARIDYVHKWLREKLSDSAYPDILKKYILETELLEALVYKKDVAIELANLLEDYPQEEKRKIFRYIIDSSMNLFDNLHYRYGAKHVRIAYYNDGSYKMILRAGHSEMGNNEFSEYYDAQLDQEEVNTYNQKYLDFNERVQESKNESYQGVIKRAGVITRNRPNQLRQFLEEFLENICVEFEHVTENSDEISGADFVIGVFDDSDSDYEKANEKIIQDVLNQYSQFSVKIEHYKKEDKKQIISDLLSKHGVQDGDLDAVTYETTLNSIFKQDVGGNRNWVSAVYGDSPYIMFDDDVHPRVSYDEKTSYPVDVLGSFNRVIDLGVNLASYVYSIHQDRSIRACFKDRLYGSKQIRVEELFKTSEFYYSGGRDMRKRDDHFFSGGAIAINPNNTQRPPFTLSSDGDYLRIEDFMLAQTHRYAFVDGVNKNDRFINMGGAIDHTHDATSRRDVVNAMYSESIGAVFLNFSRFLFEGRIKGSNKNLKEYLQSVLAEEHLGHDSLDSNEKASLRNNILNHIIFFLDNYYKTLKYESEKPGVFVDAQEVLDDYENLVNKELGLKLEAYMGYFDSISGVDYKTFKYDEMPEWIQRDIDFLYGEFFVRFKAELQRYLNFLLVWDDVVPQVSALAHENKNIGGIRFNFNADLYTVQRQVIADSSQNDFFKVDEISFLLKANERIILDKEA